MPRWSEIKRRLRKFGCYKLFEGTNHERWYSPITGKVTELSRHDSQEANPKTEAAVFKAMGVPKYDN